MPRGEVAKPAPPSECYMRLAAEVIIDAYKVATLRRAPSSQIWDSPAAGWAFLQSPKAKGWGEMMGLDWDAVLEHLENGHGKKKKENEQEAPL